MVIAAVALVVAIITAYYNKRAIPPAIKAPDLTVDVTVTPLLPQGTTDVRAKLRIHYEGGGELSDPRLVQVVLHNVGTAAISEDMYDGQPYIFRIASNSRVIGDLLREQNSATSQSRPPARLAGQELHIGPGAIHVGQELTYAILVDGEGSIEQICPLLNIVPKSRASETAVSRVPERYSAADKPFAWLAATVAIFAIIIWLSMPLIKQSDRPAPPPTTPTVTTTVTATPRSSPTRP